MVVLRRASALLGLVCALASLQLAVPGRARADHGGGGPSAGQVAAGKAAVARRERQLRAAADSVAAAERRLAGLATEAEVAVEAYDAARLKMLAARDDVTTAQLVVSVAGHRVDVARREIDHFAATAYMSGGLSAMTAIVNADGPQVLLDRVGTLDAIARSQRDATQSLEAARVYQVTVEHEAAAALARARSSAAAAASARHTAEAAVSRQSGMLQSLRSRRHELAALLTHARQHASALERARLAAIARARAAAARRAAARAAAARARAVAATPVVVGGSSGVTGNVTGTVSAATEQRALSYAEAQIGKPYQWGAAGPDTYDCSGLVMWAYAQVGVTLDHWTGFQWQEGAHISTSQLRAGDLLFFATDTSNPDTIHHVGMYVGNGQMVEAPYTGANVRISSAWRSDLIGAVRPYDR